MNNVDGMGTRIIDNWILITNSDKIYLIDYFEEEHIVSEFQRELYDIHAKFLFLIDIDLDGSKEIVVGDGLTLEIYELHIL